MYIKKKIIIIISFIIMYLLNFEYVKAKDIHPKYTMRGGAFIALSSMNSTTHVYYKPYISMGCLTDYFKILAGYTRYFDFRIIGPDYSNLDIGLNQVTLDIEAYPISGLLTGFVFNYYIGESSYNGSDYTFKIGYDFNKFSFFSQFIYMMNDYFFNGGSIDNEGFSLFLEGSYFVRKNASLDLSYSYFKNSSDALGLEIDNHILRFGFMVGVKKIVYIMGGISPGWTSSEYFISTLDVGVTVVPWTHLRISALYSLSYYYDTSIGTNNVSYLTSNYVSDSSFFSHQFIVGVTFVYN